ncbi:MAG: hypothetical protein JOY82_16960 [Streptosporangiaceae bacterium]|nr:hypothetical protein [Streptosporangiaceae bacterium]MBV9856182.1 hypothetical protein [Streptosporangiaceae bacterium]
MSFGGEPGRDDGGLPPVNIEIPDDARELERDVLAYHRELRACRRRQRLRRVFAPFTGHGAALPLIATCVAVSMLAGAMLSVVSITPASAPTVTRTGAAPARSGSTGGLPAGTRRLPAGTVVLDGRQQPVRILVSSVLVLVPARCGCGAALRRLAAQAARAHVPAFFVGTGAAAPQLARLTARYGGGTARPVYDTADVLGSAYRPAGLTVLLVHSDAVAEVRKNLPAGVQLAPALPGLLRPAAAPAPPAASPVNT